MNLAQTVPLDDEGSPIVAIGAVFYELSRGPWLPCFPVKFVTPTARAAFRPGSVPERVMAVLESAQIALTTLEVRRRIPDATEKQVSVALCDLVERNMITVTGHIRGRRYVVKPKEEDAAP